MEMMKRAFKSVFVLILLGSSVFAQSLTDVRKAIDAEQYQKAKIQLKSLTAVQPTNPEAYFFLGQVFLKTDDPDSAKVAFSEGVAKNPSFALNHVGLGQIELADNNEAAAKVHFDKAVSLTTDKKDQRTNLYIGRAYATAKKPNNDVALTYYQKALIGTSAKGNEAFLAEVNLFMGDAYRAQMKNSEAYSAYRTAFDLNKSLLRAKVELGVINKMSKAFQESVDEFNSVLAIDPNYGPAYRELAETHYLWARSDGRIYDAKIKQALDYYKKYLDLTDKSLESRMRYADFLILAKDYKTLQEEAQAMAQMDKANKRILRYLGYAAFENGNYEESKNAITSFMAQVDPKRVIGRDYIYLGRAKLKSGQAAEGIADIKMAIQIDSTNTSIMSEVGKELYGLKKYAEAAEAYELAVKNPQRNLLDYYYLGSAYYFNYGAQKTSGLAADKDLLVKADTAFSYLIQRSPTTHNAWQFRGRINRQFDDENDSQGLAVPFYEKYVEIVTVTKPELAAKNAPGLIEAYTYLGSVAARKDQDYDKAKTYFAKVLELDPANAVVLQAMKAIGGTK
jgi:tetratricopeptide (TPR) repeat protein